MKTKSLNLLLLTLIFFVLFSCTHENRIIDNQAIVKKYGNLNINLYNLGIFEYGIEELNVDYTTIFREDKIIGYEMKTVLFETEVRVNNDHSVIEVNSVNDEKTNIFNRVLNENGEYNLEPLNNSPVDNYQVKNLSSNCNLILAGCVSACVLGTAAIAASDGPLPLMDALAASFYITCNANCALDHQNCVNQ